jgi:hypothetical protein
MEGMKTQAKAERRWPFVSRHSGPSIVVSTKSGARAEDFCQSVGAQSLHFMRI